MISICDWNAFAKARHSCLMYRNVAASIFQMEQQHCCCRRCLRGAILMLIGPG